MNCWFGESPIRQGTDDDFARRLRKGAGANPTASSATRVAGTAIQGFNV
jgi:hypothetical protein